MWSINFLAVAVATVAVFVAGFGYYVAFGSQLAKVGSAAAESQKPSPWLVPVELVRSFLLAFAVAVVFSGLPALGFGGALLLGLVLWIGFPAVLMAGSVFHEKTPWKLAALHAGDWLVKLIIVALIVGLWR